MERGQNTAVQRDSGLLAQGFDTVEEEDGVERTPNVSVSTTEIVPKSTL